MVRNICLVVVLLFQMCEVLEGCGQRLGKFQNTHVFFSSLDLLNRKMIPTTPRLSF